MSEMVFLTSLTVVLLSSLSLCQAIRLHDPSLSSSTDQPVVRYCEPDTPVDNLSQEGCSSCRDRCNETNSLGREAYCSCDSGCLVYGDCCWDFQHQCPTVYESAQRIQSQVSGSPASSCLRLSNGYRYQLITECGLDGSVCDNHLSEVPLDPELGVPVQDLDTGIYYVNYRCAICNGVRRVEAMAVSLDCGSARVWSPEPETTVAPLTDTQAVLDAALDQGCRIVYGSHTDVLRECIDVIGGCPNSCSNEELRYMCQHGAQAYTQVEFPVSRTVYRNRYCAICDLETEQFLRCDHIYFTDDIGRPEPAAFSLSLLFDFNLRDGFSVSSLAVACAHDHVVLPDGVTCGVIVCPTGYTLEDGACIPGPTLHSPGLATHGNSTPCAGVLLTPSEFTLVNHTLHLLSTGQYYQQHEYIIQNDSVILCYNDSGISMGTATFSIATGLGICTIILSTMSFICLSIRIALQAINQRYNTVAGKLQCHLAVAMALALLFLLMSPLAVELELLCAVAAGLKYTAFLSCFLWMSCVACDTWWVLRPSRSCIQDNPDRPVVQYIILAWLLPIILGSVVFSLDYTGIPADYKPAFGGYACWFTNRVGLIGYFFLPVAFFIVINIVFFVLTSMALKEAFQNSASVRKTKDQKGEHLVYVKLFILMGLTWISGFVAVWVDTVAVWYIFVILNASQGMYMFVAFVLNRGRIGKVLRQCWPRKQNSSSTDTSSSRNFIGQSKGSQNSQL